MRHTARDQHGTHMADRIAVGSSVLNGGKARVEELWIAFVDDQIAIEAISILEDRQVMGRSSRVVDLSNHVGWQLLLQAEGPGLHLGHLVVEVESSEARPLRHAID